MGPYVTMVVTVFVIVFTAMTIESQSKPNIYTHPPPEAATVSANFAPTIQACKNIPESTAKKHDFHPVYIIWHGGSTKDEAHIDQGTDVPYIERRVNLPIVNSFFEPDKNEKHSQTDDNIEIDGKKYEVFYPMKSGELLGLNGEYKSKSRCDSHEDSSNRNCDGSHRLYFIDYQLVFLRHLNPDGSPVIVPGTEKEKYPYNVMDIYQNTQTASDSEVGPLPEEAFDCSKLGQSPAVSVATHSAIAAPPKMTVMIPQQQESTSSEQLQLQWFALGLPADEKPIAQSVPQLSFNIGCKPAVYLYPPQKQLVNVKVYPQGFLTYTDPLYDLKNGWTVEANPDGALSTTYNLQPTTYPYLYFESKIRDDIIKKPTKGWVIQSSVVSNQSSDSTTWFNPLAEKFQDILPKLGLNPQQTKDFIDYWRKALHPAPYYFVGIIDQKNVDQFERLDITPKPDYVNRVRIYFERLDQAKTVDAPEFPNQLISQSTNQLFRVVEWGGMVKNDLNHPFTCSQ